MLALTVAIFPGAGSVHLYHAIDDGLFAGAGLDVTLHEVTSSQEQITGWNDGRFDVMHTSPDHLLRGACRRDAVILRAEGIGELSVYARSAVELSRATWAVDGLESAFALVLRSVIADIGGVDVAGALLLAVGGTPQRAEALLAGVADGAVLHPPFDRTVAAEGGFERVGGHLDVAPQLMTVACVAPRGEAHSGPIRRYVETCEHSAAELVARGTAAVAVALVKRNWPSTVAQAAAADIIGPAGIAADSRPRLDQLAAAAQLRTRWFPSWALSQPLDALLASE